jgi:hypothetical protein
MLFALPLISPILRGDVGRPCGQPGRTDQPHLREGLISTPGLAYREAVPGKGVSRALLVKLRFKLPRYLSLR